MTARTIPTPPVTSATPAEPTVLVVGLGAPDRGDDAVGPIVARVVDEWHGPAVRVVAQEDPTGLVQLWEGFHDVIVIDAVASGAAPGTVVLKDVGMSGETVPTDAWTSSGRGGTHTFGLAGAVELSRALGTLPEHVLVVGVEAASFAHGHMSAEVSTAIVDAAETVFIELMRIERTAATCA